MRQFMDLFESKLLDRPTPTVKELATKYDVSEREVNTQLDKGIEVETEHTSDRSIAKEIALDHIGEKLDYYTLLAKVENEPINESVERVAVWSGATISVLRNPSRVAFRAFVEKHRAIRGLLTNDGEDVWLWDAGMAVHSNIMQELAIPYNCIAYTDGRWSGPVWDGYELYPALDRLTPEIAENRRVTSAAEADEIMRQLSDNLLENHIDTVEDSLICVHVTQTTSVPSILANGLLPQSGPRSRQMGDYGIYLFAGEVEAENAVGNWLGDQFAEDEGLTLLRVVIPPGSQVSRGAFEIVCYNDIPADCIQVVGEI